ncbi:SIS domain-containing protein [Candidatus Woesearchaeota archaeon]|nr:MAG: D-sedoheptulose 7-phosphate isomerase [archaeon GW2011_AR4]MBS3129423.1 SIS domain-containing protein [Candidatus Woesearchaeota archaeon]HIH38464.1 SIS domain-containing protein [Candidatus Woesearchaeota archaeon]HIH49796.1 SIS domain-containing protein [Candidatus Woesearchaeota archaeon]HIJ03477.1 SIS domain-containing protein [Candidatus Woesearchaeota archaeon]
MISSDAGSSRRDEFIKKHIEEVQKSLSRLDQGEINRCVSIFFDAWKQKKTIFFMGNGGSGSTASHFVADMSKWTIIEGRPRVRAIALTDNMPNILAWGNDDGYEAIFVEQLKNLMGKGDVVVGISGSGNSRNVIEALRYANDNNAATIAFLGFDGGKMKAIASHSVHVKNDHMGQVEGIHAVLQHIIVDALKKEIKDANVP